MGDKAFRLDEEVAELSILLPAWQAVAMERLAHVRGLTLGHLMRLLVQGYIAGQMGPDAAHLAEPEGTPSPQDEVGGLRCGNQVRGRADR
jgi:hypothetical protein